MLKSKVFDILRRLTPDELKRFRDFVRSPYHNRNKNVIGLFEIIRKYGPDFNNEGLKKEKVYSKLFPRKPFNDIVIRILLSDLLRISEDFLVQLRIEKSDYDYRKFLLSEFMDRGLDKLFLKIFRESESELMHMRIDDSYFKNKFDIEELYKGFNIDRNQQHLNSSNLVDMGKNIVTYFLIKISSVLHDISVNKGNFNTEFDESAVNGLFRFINHESIKDLIKNKDFKDNEILEIYFCAFMLTGKVDTDDYYSRLKELFFRNIDRINREAAYNLYMALLNYNGTRHWDDKNHTFRKETLEIYKDMINRGYYSWTEGGYMTIIIFRSILALCSLLKETEWMEYFVSNYVDKLAPEQRQNMYYYSHAKLSFAKRDYYSALENISKVDFNLFTFKFDVKTLMLQVYYELGYFEESYAMMDSYRHFLSNNKNVSPEFRHWNQNFVNLYNDLLNQKSGRKNIDLELLNKKITNTPNAASQPWLKDKIEELKKISTLRDAPFSA